MLTLTNVMAVETSVIILIKIYFGLAMCETVARKGTRPALWVTGFAMVAYAVHTAETWNSDAWGTLFRTSTVIGVPVILGLWLYEREARSEAEVRAARAAERTAIARELHDLVAHHLASMVLRTNIARHVVTDAGKPVQEVLDDVHANGTEALEDLRSLVAILRAGGDSATAGFPDEPVSQVAQAAVDNAVQLGAHVTSTVDPKINLLPKTIGMVVLRLTQEGLANAIHHGSSELRVELDVTCEQDSLTFVMRNNVGAQKVGRVNTGFGLAGLKERVNVFGGDFQAGQEGDTWVLKSSLPLKEFQC
ncbi:sensor histidine kinase [Haloglycomyces albus]|uniref:sensor histidine kinase n=1 Tax=Haloglycomyces albus TaxID=526067 RepID=UPI0012EC55D9|nr:histidine kinase [Haloglycomyces albus]